MPVGLLQGPVVRSCGRRGDLDLRQLAHEVGATDHADETAVAHHRHLPDAMSIENVGEDTQFLLRDEMRPIRFARRLLWIDVGSACRFQAGRDDHHAGDQDAERQCHACQELAAEMDG